MQDPQEEAAPPASQCWRCRGVGSRLAKVAPGVAAQALPCPVCKASGVLHRSAPRIKARPVKDFPGWSAPGPPPLGTAPAALAATEELCFLTGSWKILQRTDSHRYSTDDVVTAWAAARAVHALGLPLSHPQLHTADIGCGIGSVLLMTAWLFPTALCVGAEAQEGRASCARTSLALNLPAEGPARAALVQGDLRAAATQAGLRQALAGLLAQRSSPVAAAEAPSSAAPLPLFHLVTGTPPYFPVSDGGTPSHEESARCLFEYRGGVEGYCAAAAALLRPGGLFAVCQTSRELQRTYAAAQGAGLAVLGRVDVVPVQGKPPLFFVLLCCLPASGAAGGPGLPAPSLAGAFDLQGQAGSSSSSSSATSLQHLPYEEMRQPAYAQWLESTQPQAEGAAEAEAEGEGEAGTEAEAEAEAEGLGGAAAKQSARGFHVQHCGKPLGSECVSVVLVRQQGGERTAAYRRLLWEMGKPS